MNKKQIARVLEDKVDFYPPQLVIGFTIDDGVGTTGSIEEYEVGGQKGYTLYIDGDEIGAFDSVEDAKDEVAQWVEDHI